MTTTLTSAPAPSTTVASPKGPFLLLDREDILPRLNARACWVRHRLTDHPLFALPRLLQLAKTLPAKYVRINSGAVPVDATPDQIPGTGLSIDESFERLENSDTRIMLKAIDLDPEYRDLLYSCIGELEATGHPSMRGIDSRVGYIFISAPGMTTPYHMDPEINFLLQIRGKKTFFILPGDDRSILSEEDIELFYSGLHDSLTFHDEAKGRAVPFEMAPGDGVHVPVNHPHWVTTANEVTISFALTIETEATHRRGAIYAVNHMLRRRGLKPVPYGQSPARDFLKHRGYRLWRSLRRLFPGSKPPAEH
jgi:hypothetical protein